MQAIIRITAVVLIALGLAGLVQVVEIEGPADPFLVTFGLALVLTGFIVGVYEIATRLLQKITKSSTHPNVALGDRTPMGPLVALAEAPTPRPFGPRDAVVVFGAYLSGQVLVFLVIGIAAAITMGADASPEDLARATEDLLPVGLVLAVLGGAISGGLVIHYFHRSRQHVAEVMGLGLGDRKTLIAGLFIGLGLALWYLVMAAWLVPPDTDTSGGPLAGLAQRPGFPRLAWAIAGVLLAPWIEEIVFRGVLLGALLRRWTTGAAITVVTTLFVVLHLGETYAYWPAILAIATLGVVTAVARVQTGVIGPAVAIHLGYNATMVAALYATAGT